MSAYISEKMLLVCIMQGQDVSGGGPCGSQGRSVDVGGLLGLTNT